MRTIGPLLNIGLGGYMIYLGATGKGVLPLANSSIALAAAGAVAVCYGVWRIIRDRRVQ